MNRFGLRKNRNSSSQGHIATKWLALIFGFTMAMGCVPESEVSDEELESERPEGGRNLAFDADSKGDSVCGPFPAGYYRYLDDTRCQKSLPLNRDRDLMCPTVSKLAPAIRTFDGREVRYAPADASPVVDSTALRGIVPDDLRITVILVRRINGVPHYRYLSNGQHDTVVQPWSTTKFMAAANAGARLRLASSGKVGLGASVDGWAMGDLVTIVHNYDERTFTSNGLSRYFHDVGTRVSAQQLITGWLGRPEKETFGGNYGAARADLGFEFVDGLDSVTVPADTSAGPANQLSTLTLAEFLKRIVMHREDEATRMPGLTWEDAQVILYGAEGSRRYSENTQQGMEADTALYLQSAINVPAMEERSQGQWRIFSKLGHGTSRGGEFTHVGYGCFPQLDGAGEPLPERGKELFIATHLSASNRLAEGDAQLAKIYKDVASRVLDGRLK